MYTRSTVVRKFDFEIGYLVKSPCKECYLHPLSFPSCADNCEEINQIQTILAPGIACSRSSGAPESSLLSLQGWNDS